MSSYQIIMLAEGNIHRIINNNKKKHKNGNNNY